ncbi:PQQ-dependent sugar dehydrogenase [Jiulongibacter sp. NS-SX5]|uniref:PQQ-dependent sugar dehydrogenase n=1 Tax=Jiulongibacter sp. NS-SX5 TaxID=3463854 RepID=UPI0040584E39
MTKKLIIILFSAAGFGAYGQGFSVKGAAPENSKPVEGQVLETRSANNPNQQPAFEGQTRAKAVITKSDYKVTVLTDKLFHPWSIAFMPDGRMLISEKSGNIRIVNQNGEIGSELQGVPKVVYAVDAGLLDICIDPDFANNRSFYFAFVEQREGGNGLAIASAKLTVDEKSIEDYKVIFRVTPNAPVPAHIGSRIVIDKEGKILFSAGERFLPNFRVQAQWPNSQLGKIIRINKDGSPAENNPSYGENALKEIWAIGVRNPQGLAFHPETGELWESEHGQQGGDEINIIKPGKNYGWPTIAYGTEYTGEEINGGKSQQEGMEQPVYYWDPAIAPGGITFYSGKMIPEWKNNLFISSLAGQHLIRLVIDGNKVIGEERLLLDNKQRVRDVAEGPDGSLYVVTDADNGRLIRIAN